MQKKLLASISLGLALFSNASVLAEKDQASLLYDSIVERAENGQLQEQQIEFKAVEEEKKIELPAVIVDESIKKIDVKNGFFESVKIILVPKGTDNEIVKEEALEVYLNAYQTKKNLEVKNSIDYDVDVFSVYGEYLGYLLHVKTKTEKVLKISPFYLISSLEPKLNEYALLHEAWLKTQIEEEKPEAPIILAEEPEKKETIAPEKEETIVTEEKEAVAPEQEAVQIASETEDEKVEIDLEEEKPIAKEEVVIEETAPIPEDIDPVIVSEAAPAEKPAPESKEENKEEPEEKMVINFETGFKSISDFISESKKKAEEVKEVAETKFEEIEIETKSTLVPEKLEPLEEKIINIPKPKAMKSKKIISSLLNDKTSEQVRKIKIANISNDDVVIEIENQASEKIGNGWMMTNDIYVPEFLDFNSEPVSLEPESVLIITSSKSKKVITKRASELNIDEKGNYVWFINDDLGNGN